jgi:signal peptidase I
MSNIDPRPAGDVGPAADGPRGPDAGSPDPGAQPAPARPSGGTEGESPPADQPPESKRSGKGGLNPFIELLVILAVAFGLAYVVQGWVVKPYRIPSASMQPTLEVGDMVLVNRFVYRLHGPHRGDIVVFHPPGHGDVPIRGAATEASVNFIKRIVALPDETIQITNGVVDICAAPHRGCHVLHESYIHSTNYGNYGPYTVPKGDYFVMGDNRGNSDDSRVWGPLPRRNIIGQAFLIYWPLDRLGPL